MSKHSEVVGPKNCSLKGLLIQGVADGGGGVGGVLTPTFENRVVDPQLFTV